MKLYEILIDNKYKYENKIMFSEASAYISYEEFLWMTDSLADFILQTAVIPNPKIGVCMNNSCVYIALILAADKLNCDLYLFDADIPRSELVDNVNDNAINIIFTDTFLLLKSELSENCKPFYINNIDPAGKSNLSKILSVGLIPSNIDKVLNNHKSSITLCDSTQKKYSINSTWLLEKWREMDALTLSDSLCSSVPGCSEPIMTDYKFSSRYGLLHMLSALERGKTYHVASIKKIDELIYNLITYKIVGVHLSPAMFRALLQYTNLSSINFPSLRYIMYDMASTPLVEKLLGKAFLSPDIQLINNHTSLSYEDRISEENSDTLLAESATTHTRYSFCCKINPDSVIITDKSGNILSDRKIGFLKVKPMSFTEQHSEYTFTGILGFQHNSRLYIYGHRISNNLYVGSEVDYSLLQNFIDIDDCSPTFNGSKNDLMHNVAQSAYSKLTNRFHNFLDYQELINYYFSIASIFVDANLYSIQLFGNRISESRSGMISQTELSDFSENESESHCDIHYEKDKYTCYVPLISGSGTVMGVISFSRTGKNWFFTMDELTILGFLGYQLSTSLYTALNNYYMQQKCNIMEQIIKMFQYAIVIHDTKGNIIFKNSTAAKMMQDPRNVHGDVKSEIFQNVKKITDALLPAAQKSSVNPLFEGFYPNYYIRSLLLPEEESIVSIIIINNTKLDFSHLSTILTERETEVVKLVFEGLSNAEIAKKLFISNETVKTHIKNIFNKMNVNSRSKLLVKICSLLPNI